MAKLSALLDLTRVRNPAGFLLLFFPCAFGTLLAANSVEQLWYLPMFLLGSITMRGAGCIINDLIDRKIDALVDRTKYRPLVTGAITKQEAVVLLFLLMLISLPILLILKTLAIVIGFLSLILVALYPWMKRITYFPQVFLGLTFNVGALIAYAGIGGNIDTSIMLVYLGCIFWTLGYDTIYAFMDMEDDAKIGVKSSALFFSTRSYKMWITTFYLIFTVLMLFVTLYVCGMRLSPFVSAIVAFGILVWQVLTLDIHTRHNCFTRWQSNIYVGIAWMCGLLDYSSL